MDEGLPLQAPLEAENVFRGLTDDQLARAARSGKRIRIPLKSTLFRQGDPARRCYLVTRGRVKLSKLSETGKEAILRFLGPGQMAAAVAALTDTRYPATAEAVEPTEVVGWDKRTFLRLMHDHPPIAFNLLRVTLERLDEIQQRYLELSSEVVERRIARTLLRLMRHAGSRTRSGVLITIPLSRQSIADYSGTTLYTVSRTLTAWGKIGWVRSGRERVTVTDPHALVLFAEQR
ncbi:MAG: Crp/Fnr family transcriptional regulator [Candidatus Methylomirabilota bacterium]